ncbi:MAG TPA: hypothetical protein VE736_10135 [Gaiellaceae bacterium]|nr:hypothetical protein [Gaiellaceae bacterium]
MKRWAPTALIVALLAATAVAFATTERQKLERTPFGVLPVARAVSPARGPALIRLRLHRRHLLTVQILDTRDRVVATLVREQRYEAGIAAFRWRADVPDGLYTPRVTLDDGRIFTLPLQIRIDSVPPTATLVFYRPHVLHRVAKPQVRIGYRVSEKAHILLYVNGRRALVGGAKSLHFAVNWVTRRNGRRLRPGRYRLQLAAVDLAGNIGPRTRPFVVRIR